MQLILVGNFNPKDAMVWIRKNFGALSSVGKSPRVEASPKPRETPLIMNYSSSFLGHHIWLGTKYWNIDFADEVVLRAYFRYLSLHLMNRIRSQNAKTYTATDLFLSDTRRFGYGMVTMDSPPEAFEENFKYVTDRIRSETQEKRFLEADIKEMRQIFRNHEAAVDTDVESLYHLALAALYSKTTFGKIQSRVGTLEALSDADIRARLSKLFDPKKEIRMLIKPPLFFSYEEFVFFVLSILLGLFLGRRLFFRKENEVSRTDFQVAIRHGIWGRIQIYGGAFLVLALIGWVGREVVGLEVLRDLMRQSIVLRELVLSPIEILLKVLGVCLFLSRFVRRVSVVDGKLILRFRGYYSRTFPLHEIRVEPVSLLKGLFRNPRHAHPAYFGFRGKGLLISHRSGETFFVGVDDPKRAASEIRSLAEVTQPKASSG